MIFIKAAAIMLATLLLGSEVFAEDLNVNVIASEPSINFPITFKGYLKESNSTYDSFDFKFHTLPGLSFCVGFSTVGGAGIAGKLGFGARNYNLFSDNDFQKCVQADEDGNASAGVNVYISRKGLLVVNVVTADSKINTFAVLVKERMK